MPDYTPIQITINDKPRAILRGMQDLNARREQGNRVYQQRRWIPLLLFLAGFPLFCVDFALTAAGYNSMVFSLAAPLLWIAAFVAWLSLRRARNAEFPPQIQTAREIVYTLRDDLDPKRNFFGQLDLTGTRKDTKVAREASNALGLVTRYYRDEWLSLKAKLYDGNMLRLAAVQREKVRKGYWKRSRISGKNKWKPEKFKGSRQDLKLRISINPNVYDTSLTRSLAPGARIGAYTVSQYSQHGGIIDLSAWSNAEHISAQDVLGVMHAAYDQLQRKA
jgi:hypothetical protein